MQTLTDRMGEDMRVRGFAPKTQQAYRGAVVGLAQHFARLPDTLAAADWAAQGRRLAHRVRLLHC